MTSLRDKDHDLYRLTGIKRFWLITSGEEFFWEVKQHMADYKGLKPRTVDFTSMYTKLTHESTITNVEKAIREAIAYQIERGVDPLCTTTLTALWS